jgi:hypothetical protein
MPVPTLTTEDRAIELNIGTRFMIRRRGQNRQRVPDILFRRKKRTKPNDNQPSDIAGQ